MGQDPHPSQKVMNGMAHCSAAWMGRPTVQSTCCKHCIRRKQSEHKGAASKRSLADSTFEAGLSLRCSTITWLITLRTFVAPNSRAFNLRLYENLGGLRSA